jgi:cyclophilin family peptidyl-prolyl cis-trans isomerase
LIAAGAAVGVLLLGLVVLWAAGVFRVKTKDGTIVLENLPADAEVVVDGETLTIKSSDGKAVAISVAAGKKHQLQVKKEGFKVFGEEVEIDAGGRRAIRVRLEQEARAVPQPVPSVVGVWEHSVPSKRIKGRREFMPDGTIKGAAGGLRATWLQEGSTLTLTWGDQGTLGRGIWVDKCTVAPDGKSYTGRDLGNDLVFGKRIENPVVVMTTSLGTIKIELYPDKAPVTVANFLAYVDSGFYDGTIFHRVIPTFVIQGGGIEAGKTPDAPKTTREPIKNESANDLSNERGTIAMARTDRPDSATSQFFINVMDNGIFDRANARDRVGYCVFGKVIEGMDVIDKINAVETRTVGNHKNVPVKDVVIESVRRAKQ